MTRLLRGESPANTAAEPADATTDPEEHTPDAESPGETGTSGSESPGEADASGSESPGEAGTSGSESPGETGAPESAGADADEPSGRRLRGVVLRRVAVGVTAAVLVLGGCGFFYGSHQLRSVPSAENRALTDNTATTRVAGDVGNDLARVFSYTPDGLDAGERSARSVLTGRAARQYTELVGRIRAEVVRQRVTLSTQAVRVGVIELHGDTARLLVFLDQTSRRGKAAATTAAAQLTVTAQQEHDQWRIVDIQTR
ncbi:hypothetical protein ABZ858_12660 [Streptomyces sp. NPDC047017]|uniref:hypothetical protein n=1 Tax=Streptomyces sp. NPDC047017 TaxID=3155024 RepID=UPI0034036C1E